MTDAELEKLLRHGETDRIERKQAVSDPGDIRQAICAFANDLPDHRAPGVIFVGVRDDGSCAKLTVTDQLLTNLAHMRSDGNILPFPSMVVQKRVVSGCELAVVIVEPSSDPPVRYKGRCWIRVGTRRATATIAEEARLSEKRRYRDLPFDVRPIESASMRDLDLELFTRVYLPAAVAPEVLEQNQRSLEHQLAALRLTAWAQPPTPTILGCLVLGKEPANFIGGAYVQFLRIDGVQLTDPIKDAERIGGPLPDVVRKLDAKFEAHISTQVDVASGPTEIRRPDYPLAALQQISRNAILHRTYEATNTPVRVTWLNDRIEIVSPGGVYGTVTPENFGRPGVTDYRNLHLAEAMRHLGYVQKFGLGIQLAREALRRNGNPEVAFAIEANYIGATIRKGA